MSSNEKTDQKAKSIEGSSHTFTGKTQTHRGNTQTKKLLEEEIGVIGRWKGQIYRPKGPFMSLEAIHRVGRG